MPVFVRNLNLEFLTENGALKSDRMLQMYERARWRHAHGAYYLTYAMPSGVEFIFKTVQDGEDLRVVGTDTHLSGRCIWNAIPFMNVTPPNSDDLTAVVACTNVAQDGVFIAHFMNAAVLPTIEEGQSLAMQMAAFPYAVAVYESREAYEMAASQASDDDDGQPIILSDRRIFPLNFMLKHDPDVPDDQRNQNLRDDIMLVCGSILEVQKREHADEDALGASFLVATISTQFGHLDVAFTTDMLAQSTCEKGQYLVFSGIFSANVAIEGFENWIED
jgi:hypothetical protein